MSYQRIHIIGAPGSGKTSIANYLSSISSYPAIDLDDLFWNTKKVNSFSLEEVRHRELIKIIREDQWILEGSYFHWLYHSFERADLIILLQPSVWIRDWRLLKRFFLRRLGFLKSDHKDTFKALWNTLQWNHTFNQNYITKIINMIYPHQNKVVSCKNFTDIWNILQKEPA